MARSGVIPDPMEPLAAGVPQAKLDVTLSREGKDGCTISLNTKTSPLANGVRWSNSDCLDILAPRAMVAYRARVKATDMVPMAVRLDVLQAVRK